jgi:microsomal dipeptidase-like Zn-dependent dipeptidase
MTESPAAQKPMPVIDCMQYSKWERAHFKEWQAGGLSCVHVTLSIWENARETLSVIGQWNRLLEQNGDLIALARSVADIDAINRAGKVAVIYGFQNTSPLEDDIELVEVFHALGVRIIQLTYNIQNNVAAGCWEDVDPGISKVFGRNVIREMNRVGILIDLSHTAPKSCADAIELSEKPVAFTHANPAEFVGTDIELKRRTKSTELVKSLCARGGVIGLGMYPKMSKDGSQQTLDTFCDMVAWTADLVGIDAVAFGTDFYSGHPVETIKWWRAGRFARESPVPIQGGMPNWPTWFKNPSDFPKVIAGLRRRGMSEEDVAKVAHGNWRRLFAATFRPSNAVP